SAYWSVCKRPAPGQTAALPSQSATPAYVVPPGANHTIPAVVATVTRTFKATPGPAAAAPPGAPATLTGPHTPETAQHVDATPPVAGDWDWLTLTLVLQVLYYGYLCGVLIFGLNLLVQVAVVGYQIRHGNVIKDGKFRIVETKGDKAPCSFGRYIFINPGNYDEETYHQILSHEKVHAEQRHSVDILLAELGIVLQWFNPFAWFFRKALENNLEFLTDAAIIRNPRVNASRYQMSL